MRGPQDIGASVPDRATLATPQAPTGLGHSESIASALLAVVAATRAYLPPDGIDEQECINRILEATDNPEISPIILEIENARS